MTADPTPSHVIDIDISTSLSPGFPVERVSYTGFIMPLLSSIGHCNGQVHDSETVKEKVTERNSMQVKRKTEDRLTVKERLYICSSVLSLQIDSLSELRKVFFSSLFSVIPQLSLSESLSDLKMAFNDRDTTNGDRDGERNRERKFFLLLCSVIPPVSLYSPRSCESTILSF